MFRTLLIVGTLALSLVGVGGCVYDGDHHRHHRRSRYDGGYHRGHYGHGHHHYGHHDYHSHRHRGRY